MCPLPFRSTFLIDAKVLMRHLKSSKYNEIMDTKNDNGHKKDDGHKRKIL